MSKRKKVQISEENKDFSVYKAKKGFRRNTELIGETDLENPAQTIPSNNSPLKATKAGRMKKCKGNSLENTETQILTQDLETSSAEEGGKASFERKELGHSKVFLPPSQVPGGKLTPLFTKSKKPLAERHERDYGKDSTVWIEQDMSESSGAQQSMVRNVPDATERPFQSTSESLGLMDLLLSKGEEAGDQLILPCEEWSGNVDVKMQDQERIRSVNSGDDDSHQKMGIAINLYANVCDKEIPEKQISFVLQTSDNEAAEGLEKRELSFGSLIKDMSFSMLAEGKISDHLKSSQCEKEHASSSKEQNKAMQDIIKSGYVEETKWAKNGSREDAGFVERMASQTQNENNITQPPLVTDLSVLAPEEQSSSLYISNAARVGSGGDGKGIDQNPLYRSGNTEEQRDICSSSNDFSEAGGAQYSSTISENTADQHSLWTSGKPGEQSSPCRRERIVAEQNNYHEGQDTSGEDFPDTWSVCIDLEKEADISEPKCEQVIETTSNLFCPQPGGGDVHSETRKTSVQAALYSEEKEPGTTAKPAKNTATSQEEGEIPILFQPQQQWKESERETLLVPNIKQLELDGLRPSEIRETLFNANITHQNLTKNPKDETKPDPENCSSSTDVHLDGKEVIKCGGNKSQPICVESCLSSTNVLPQLEREMGPPATNRYINADSEAQQPLHGSCTGSSIGASSDFEMVTQTQALCRDPLNLEYLPHSQLQSISESNSFEFPLDKLFSLDNQHTHSKGTRDHFTTAGGDSGIEPPAPVVHAGLGHPNNAKVEMMERICDPSEQEDATDVVCGLIKELSNLNRLIMSKHRDLDSFKRLKFRRNRQSGKSLLHGVNNMTSTLCTMKKKQVI